MKAIKDRAGILSRRTFLEGAAGGAVGAAFALADPGAASAAPAQTAVIKIEALPISYVSSAPSSRGISWGYCGNKYATVFGLRSVQNPDIVMIGKPPSGEEGLGRQYSQWPSLQYPRGLVLRNSTRTVTSGESSVRGGQPDHTGFFGLRDLQLNLAGNFRKLRFSLKEDPNEFGVSVAWLRSSEDPVFLKPGTRQSIASQFVEDPALIVSPRFAQFQSVSLPAGMKEPVEFIKKAVPEPEELTAAVSVEIREQTGFT